ncbi:hypothetical protein CPSG_00392 [Coccidioides posadasii str. Silveira]|uniref:Uncharacterized protein n=1 Tax=Coccidioides posadasii (strain RMSCC 757 / Silveira) TaxID=443226 RepID=E9CRX0_COCPS|nr:hypothetical protein CPSG_00392 [Coccidioides posadasii str. Silveira]
MCMKGMTAFADGMFRCSLLFANAWIGESKMLLCLPASKSLEDRILSLPEESKSASFGGPIRLSTCFAFYSNLRSVLCEWWIYACLQFVVCSTCWPPIGLVPTPRKCAYLSTISAPACKHKTGDHMCSSLCRYLLLPAYCIDAPSDLAPVLITSLPSSGTKSKGCVFQDTLFFNPDRSPFDVFATVPRKRIIARSYALSAWHKKGREQEVKPKT